MCGLQQLTAQQLPLFTQYREHHSYINPASLSWDYFTYRYRLNIGISHRSQWANVEGGPNAQLLHGEYIWEPEGPFSLLTGAHFLSYNTAPERYTGSFGRIVSFFSKNLYEGALAIGLSFGGVQYSVDKNDIIFPDPDDIIALENRSFWFQDVSVGMFFHKRLHGDNLYGGLSVPQFKELDLGAAASPNKPYSLKRIRHLYANLGYYKYLNQDSFIESSIWIKCVPNIPIHANMNFRFQYSNIAWLGVGYATNQSLHFEFGVLLGENLGFNNLARIGYGYETSISAFNRGSFGNTHEVNLNYSIDWK